jgi:hypothetical protein
MLEYAGAPVVVDSVAEAWELVAVHPFQQRSLTSTCRFLVLQHLLLLSSQLHKPKELTHLASPLLETTWEETASSPRG